MKQRLGHCESVDVSGVFRSVRQSLGRSDEV